MAVMRRIHHVSCSQQSDDIDTEDFERAERDSLALKRYARQLGFDVLYENVDQGDDERR